MPCMCSQKSIGLATASQAPKVCDRHCHFGAGDSVVVCCCPSCLEVHSKVTHWHVIDKGVRQCHLESLGGSLAVLVDTHSSKLAQVRVVEACVEHVEAVGVCAVGREPEGFVVVQGATMETFQWRKAVGVEATDLCRAAHCGYTVTQRCEETGHSINTE